MPKNFSCIAQPYAPVSGGTIFLQEDYNTYTAGAVTSVTSPFSTKGYIAVTFTNSGDISVLARGSMPAGLTGDANFPAGKTKVCLFTLPAVDVESRLTWAGFPSTTVGLGSIVSWSWWEYRPNGNSAAEKFHRAGNWVNGTVGVGNRGIDDVLGFGNPAGTLTLFSNSANMHGFIDQPFGTFNWSSGLHHFERVDHLPTDTSSTYACEFYIDGVLQGSTSGLQIFDTTAQASVGWQLWDFGGWGSAGSGSTFPISRYMCAARIASTRQGVWPMSAV